MRSILSNGTLMLASMALLSTSCSTTAPAGAASPASGASVAKPVIKPVPAADLEIPYYDRHKIDISNLRDFYQGLLIADLMIHANGMFDAKVKWKLTLHQMILLGSNHHQARAAKQLSLMGVPMAEILAVWAPNYPSRVKDPRMRAAFEFVTLGSAQPSSVTADTHAMLRTHFIDRQIAELFELVALNAGMATHDLLLPIPTDQATIEWAQENLAGVGWKLGRNAASSPEEQRAALFVGEALKSAHEEILADWKPEDLAAPEPEFKTDWVNLITGYDISPVTFDRDKDGIEDPFDSYPDDYTQWKTEALNKENLPRDDSVTFDVSGYDYEFYTPSPNPATRYPPSDRMKFDSEWVRQTSIGTVAFDKYHTAAERALDFSTKWSYLFVTQLASGCGHCQVHGAYGMFYVTEDEYENGDIPADDYKQLMARIYAMMDFERSELFTDAEKAAFRLCRDGGVLPTRTTAAHIEELRRHYTDREIQELVSVLVMSSWLASSMQSQLTVTDRESMAWALKYLTAGGWKPGPHIGMPHEQRRFHMAEIVAMGFAMMNSGKIMDNQGEWLDADVPLAIDSDGDGVEDGFDGFPNDPSRWADTDGDGIEDEKDKDIDGDGLTNEEELSLGTFPYKADSDADGLTDGEELKAKTDPVDPRVF